MKANIKNEREKRKYFRRLKGAKGYSDDTINSIEKSILRYEDFSEHADFNTFSQSKAIKYKEWLMERKHRGRQLSLTTIDHHLRHLKGFFTWLSGQTGFKSRIDLDSVSYLTMDRKKLMQARTQKPVKSPSLEYVKKLTGSIEIRNEIDRRDRALISFLLLSGMRDKAISTLPIMCFDPESLEIRQDPSAGVDTKFGKLIISRLLQFDNDLVRYVLEWVGYLQKTKLFSTADPMFPKTKVEHVEDGLTFIAREVEPKFWKGTGPIRDILKKRSAAVGLEYYKPHSFRHSAIQLAMRCYRTPEEMKAISQNFGHEDIGTTFSTYGNLDEHRVKEVLGRINFDPANEMDFSNEEIIRAIKTLSSIKKT